jgi:hypothetical protein
MFTGCLMRSLRILASRVYDAFDGDRDGLAAYLDIVEELDADGRACFLAGLLRSRHGAARP